MTNQATHNDKRTGEAEDGRIHVGIRSTVISDAEFRAAVEVGAASYETGPNRDLETVAAEIRRSLLASP